MPNVLPNTKIVYIQFIQFELKNFSYDESMMFLLSPHIHSSQSFKTKKKTGVIHTKG